jgi:membrane protein
MPSTAFALVDSTKWEITNASGAGKLSFGLLAALWAASNGMSAITQTLNAAYNLKETRPWWKQRAVAIFLTVTLSLLTISALLLVVAGGKIANRLASVYGFQSAFTIAWNLAQWPIAIGFMILSFALIYYFAPDSREQSWKWLSPGSAIGVVLWLLVSFGLKGYLHFFDSYNKTYGSLGAVIVLMLWLYLTAVAVLIGGELNSQIENAAAQHGTPDEKPKGEREPSDLGGHKAA